MGACTASNSTFETTKGTHGYGKLLVIVRPQHPLANGALVQSALPTDCNKPGDVVAACALTDPSSAGYKQVRTKSEPVTA
jgi:hypothetical protein